MKSKIKFLILIVIPLVFGISGCATRYTVRVDALSAVPSRPAEQQLYVLENKTPGDEADSLFFKEIERHLEPVLRKAGLRAAADAAPELKISVKAYLSEPLVETRTAFNPVYMNYPGDAVVVRVPVMNKEGKVVRYAYTSYYTRPRRDLAGYVDRDLQVTVYDKVLELNARAMRPDGSLGEEVWSIKIALRNQSTDYRTALPAMLVAAEPFIGRRTDGEEFVFLRDNSPELEAYRALMRNGR